MYDQQAKERQKRKPKSVPVNLPEQKGDARDLAGKAVGVSGKTVDAATKVLEQGKLIAAAHSGVAVSFFFRLAFFCGGGNSQSWTWSVTTFSRASEIVSR